MIKKIAILGSTGSIGVSTLDVISRLRGKFRIIGLSADSNIAHLAKQARLHRPKIISVRDEHLAKKMRADVPAGVKITFGMSGLREIVSRGDVDLVVFAISGTSCLMPLLHAIEHKKGIALANKESLVSAGSIVMRLAKKNNVRIIPIDSEHSAIFQCVDGRSDSLSRIYLTGSGGPLLKVSKNKFGSLSKSFILNHPKWKMGKKISVDSATMMNKGLEIIEAKHLFGIDEKFIEVLIHPEAIVHSMVELTDGAILAQLGVPDMRLPIQYALTYPVRANNMLSRVDFSKIDRLSFARPDIKRFPCLALAREAAKAGGTAPAVLCSSDEEVVKKYLNGNISFTDIPDIIETVLSRHKNLSGKELTMRGVLEAEAWAREETKSLCYP